MPSLVTVPPTTSLTSLDDFTVNANLACSTRLKELEDAKEYRNSKVVNISSAEGHGPVIKELAQECLLKLQKNAAPGVKFDKFRLEDSCWGGTCSAQSLNFADLIVGSSVKPLSQKVISIAKQNTTSSLNLRTQQAALNAIAKDESTSERDFSRAKVESIVALRDFKVDFASEPLKLNVESIEQVIKNLINKNRNAEDKEEELRIYQSFHSVVSKLPDGMYFTRMLCDAENYKMEYFGHSLIYIKDASGHYLFDPAKGLHEISIKNWQAQLFKLFYESSAQWLIGTPRFYRIVKKDSLTSRLESAVNSALSLKPLESEKAPSNQNLRPKSILR